MLLIALVDFSAFSASSQTLLPPLSRARAYDAGQNLDAAAGAVHGAAHSRARWNAVLGCPAFTEKHRSWLPNPVGLQDLEAVPCSELLVHVLPHSRAKARRVRPTRPQMLFLALGWLSHIHPDIARPEPGRLGHGGAGGGGASPGFATDGDDARRRSHDGARRQRNEKERDEEDQQGKREIDKWTHA